MRLISLLVLGAGFLPATWPTILPVLLLPSVAYAQKKAGPTAKPRHYEYFTLRQTLGKKRRKWDDAAQSVVYSPDGRYLASGHDRGQIRIWVAATGELVTTLAAHRGCVERLAFSPDSSLLASGASAADRTVALWDVATWKAVGRLEGFRFHVGGLAFHPNGRRLAVASLGLTIWDVETRKRVATLVESDAGGSALKGLAYGPKGRVLACGGDEKIRVWDVGEGDDYDLRWSVPEKRFGGGKYGCMLCGLSMSADGSDVIVTYYFSKLLHVHDVKTGKRRRVFRGHRTEAVVGTADRQGHFLFSGGHDWKVRLWDYRRGRLLRTFKTGGGDALAVAFHPTGRLAAAALGDGRVKVFGWRR